MQTRTIRYIGLALVVYLGIGVLAHFNRPDYGRCEFYTKELNGGTKTIRDTTYFVKLCGADIENGTEIKLQIFDATGELIALRYFSYYINSATERDLVDTRDSIIYYDSSSNEIMRSIPIPPAKWDWILARLPLF